MRETFRFGTAMMETLLAARVGGGFVEAALIVAILAGGQGRMAQKTRR
jgi:hypothetical protein